MTVFKTILWTNLDISIEVAIIYSRDITLISLPIDIHLHKHRSPLQHDGCGTQLIN